MQSGLFQTPLKIVPGAPLRAPLYCSQLCEFRPGLLFSPALMGPEILRLLCPKNFSQTSPMQLTLISTFIYMYLCIRTWRIQPAKPFFYLHCLYGVFSFFIFLSLILNLLLNQPQLLQRVFDFHHRVHKTWSILASLIHFSM
jgi:hypothetical protein